MKRYRVYYLIVLLAISYGRAQVFGFEEDRNLAMDTVEFNIDMKFYVHGISTVSETWQWILLNSI